MKRNVSKIISLLLLVLAVFFMKSCSEDANNGTIEGELTQAEVQTILEAEEIAGVADNALAELFAESNTTNKAAKSNECYAAEYTDTGFTATFNNCVLNGTDNVNGTLVVVYEVGEESASFTATYADFYVGNIKINGSRNFAIIANAEASSIGFEVTSNLTIELENGDEIIETGTKTFGFAFGETLEETTFSLSGSWSVQADGNTYVIESNGELVGSFGCAHLTSGNMDISKNGLVVNVDFGDGTCDDVATITYPNGATEEITL